METHDDISAKTEHMRHAWRCRIDTVAKQNVALAHRHPAKRLATLPQLGQLEKVALHISQVHCRMRPPISSCAARFTNRSGIHGAHPDRKSTRLNSSHLGISYAVFCL